MKFSALYGKLLAPYMMRRALKWLGRKPRIAGWLTVRGGGNISIGDDFFAGPNFYISTNRYAKVVFGDAVMFGPDVMVLGGNHDYSYAELHLRFNESEDPSAQDIKIASGSWVGARAVILSGADIGEGAIVGACSVVNKKIPPYTVAVGAPVRIVKPRFQSVAELELCLKNTGSPYSLMEILNQYKLCGFVLK